MSGFTKHLYIKRLQDINKELKLELELIKHILPRQYNHNDIISLLKKFYKYEWKLLERDYNYYKKKDDSLRIHGKKIRYQMPLPEEILKRHFMYKQLMQPESIELYNENYNEEIANNEYEKLCKKRCPRIKKIDDKIKLATSKMQLVTPEFIDKLIGYYSRKNALLKDKACILKELKKYYCEKVINFFEKINDTELNYQLRLEAFKHLQSLGYNPRLRKQKYIIIHTRNKKRKQRIKKEYIGAEHYINETPKELVYQLEFASFQKCKSYDYFISHSFKDADYVQKLISYLNTNNKYVYCDWINDSDYLKRKLLCKDTLNVIKHQLEKSNSLIFVNSENSKNSDWCKFELQYFYKLKKPIYYVDINDLNFSIFKEESTWFLNENIDEEKLFKKIINLLH